MQVSHSHFTKYTSKSVQYTSPCGLFICDGQAVNRTTVGRLGSEAITISKRSVMKNEEPNERKITRIRNQSPPQSLQSKNSKEVSLPEIVMVSKASSHFPVKPPLYTYLNNSAVNEENMRRAAEINLHRKIYFDDSNRNIPKSEYLNRIWFPATKRMHSLQKILQ